MPIPDPTSITIEPDPATVQEDEYVQLAVTAYDSVTSTSEPADPRFVTFESSDPDVATVPNTLTLWGRCRGIAVGTATITATHTSQIGGFAPVSVTDTVEVTVTERPPYSPPTGRFLIGFDTSTLAAQPETWTRIDDHPNLVTSYSIDRGRSEELDQTDAGTATVEIQDPTGILDPTNPAGPYHGQIRPLLHAAICRQNPVTLDWEQRYRGFIEDFAYEVNPSQRVNRLTVQLVDLFEVATSAEMQPGQFGTNDNSQSAYPIQRPDQRIGQILNELGLPPSRRVTLPSTVNVRASLYSIGEQPLTAILEAADADFPQVANFFCDRQGRMCFHGRKAKFDPEAVSALAGPAKWDYHSWKVGDGAAIAASPEDTAQVRALSFNRGVSKLINSAVALPVGVDDDETMHRRVIDQTSIDTYGIRSWSVTNLLTLHGDVDQPYPTSALRETARFAAFYVENYARPRNRITELAVKSVHPADPRAATTWDLLCKVDIGDTVQVTVAAAGGGGFVSEQYFVEGVHEEAQPAGPDYDEVTVQLDLSPRRYYTGAGPGWPEDPGDPEDDPDVPEDPEDTFDPLDEPDDENPDGIDDYNPPHRSRKPKPFHHARDHEHDGTDPLRMHYEDVGTDAGGGTGVGGFIDTVPYSVSGDLEVSNGGLRYYALWAGTITQVWASVGTPATGSGVTVRLNRNGASIGTVTIPAGDNSAGFTPADPSALIGDYFTVDITAVGSTTPGADLVVELRQEAI